MNSALMSEAEVAVWLRVRPRTVGVWRRKRGLPCVRIGRKKVLFVRAEVETWLKGEK